MRDGLWSRRGRGIVDYKINLKMNLKKMIVSGTVELSL